MSNRTTRTRARSLRVVEAVPSGAAADNANPERSDQPFADPGTVESRLDDETLDEEQLLEYVKERRGSVDPEPGSVEVLPHAPQPTPALVERRHASQPTAVLCGADRVSREDLGLVPLPDATRTHKPVAHIAVVEALVECLAFRHISVVREEYVLAKEGLRMFGVLELGHEFSGCRFAVGVRNANDKAFRLGLTVGYRVFVCENLAFSGDFRPVLAKHSAKLELLDVLSIGVDRMQRNFEPIKRTVLDWQRTEITDDQAKLAIYDAFIAGRLPAPQQLAAAVDRNYFHPQFPEFEPRTLWSLENAFTCAFKELRADRQFAAAGKLHTFLQSRVTPF